MFGLKKKDSPSTLVVDHFGVKLEIDSSTMSEKMFNTIKNGYYENEEASGLPHIFQEDEVILELGGGIGFVSSFAMKDPRVKEIHVYEANPGLIPLIKRTHELNDTVAHVNNEIVGDSDGEIDFYIHEDFWASTTVYWEGATPTKIPMVSFQKIIDTNKPTLIIADIEGGEISLFDNVQLTGVKKIYMEVHQNVIGRSGVKHVFDKLSAQGFHYDVWHSNREIVMFSHVDR